MISRTIHHLKYVRPVQVAMPFARMMIVAPSYQFGHLVRPRPRHFRIQSTGALLPFGTRLFSSSTDKHQDEDPEQLKQRLLQASLIHAKYRGFNDEAIVAGCRDLDLPAVTSTILRNGPYDIVLFAQDEWLR